MVSFIPSCDLFPCLRDESCGEAYEGGKSWGEKPGQVSQNLTSVCEISFCSEEKTLYYLCCVYIRIQTKVNPTKSALIMLVCIQQMLVHL